MKTLHSIAPALSACLLFATRASGQTPATGTSPSAVSAAPAVTGSEEQSWTLSASAYLYFVPESTDYVQPTVSADHDYLHLGARYNYENLRTASFWVGANFSGGEEVSWELTPMLGGVVGKTNGVAPGYQGHVSWWLLELSSEGEYVFDLEDGSNNFFYNWSELSLSPLEWFRFGLVAQRTRVFQNDRDLQRGLLAGFSYKKASLTTYVFNPDDAKPFVVVALAFSFDL
jgi:hypothetical protein